MRSKLIIDGNAVYEIDEDCMLKKNKESRMKKDTDREEDREEQSREET